jgi:anaerobic selenocysteine-containing dehydrogenase
LVTRRDFLKLSGMCAAAAGAAWAGLRQPGSGAFPFSVDQRVVATLCNECSGLCAVQVHVAGGRVLEVQGNPAHPLACLGACDGFEAALSRLEAPERLRGPLGRSAGRGTAFQPISWQAASALVGQALVAYPPHEVAFVLGDFPDHLSDLVGQLAGALGGAWVLRYSPSALLDGRVTLQDAVRRLFGLPRLPFFDLARSNLVYAFGADRQEPWVARPGWSPNRPSGQRWVHFAALPPSGTLAHADDEWVHIRPGSEAWLAQGLGQLIAHLLIGAPTDQPPPTEALEASQASEVSLEVLADLARRFIAAPRSVAVPGAGCLGQSHGLAAAQAVLALNVRAGRLGRAGGMYLAPEAPLHPELNGRTATLAEMQALIERMQRGLVKALFVHGVDLIADLPPGLEVGRALEKVERVIAFNSLASETSACADALLPDHLPLEGWGYQRVAPAADRALVSAIQPALPPRYTTRSTADLLLDAVGRIGGALAARLPYRTEQEFIRRAAERLPWAAEVVDPWGQWLAQGGWWGAQSDLLLPVSLLSAQRLPRSAPASLALDPSGAEFYLLLARPAPGGAALPARSAMPYHVGIHPAAARRLGLRQGDGVRLASMSAEIEAQIILRPDIQPDTLVLPLMLGRPGGSKLLDLVYGQRNESGDMAYQTARVRVFPSTGKALIL